MKKSFLKKIVSIVLTITMVITILPSMTMLVSAETGAWDGSIATGYAGGDGTEENPYQITDATQLAYFANDINENYNNYNGKYIELISDINLDGGQWTPIYKDFYGNFNGNNHIISNMKIGTYESPATYTRVGFFRYMNGGTLENVRLEDFIIYSNPSSWTACVGGLVGKISGGTIKNCYATGTITHTSNHYCDSVGGLVGENSDTIITSYITNCYASVNISFIGNDFNYVGGLVGKNNSAIINSYATGDITAGSRDCWVRVGGLVGWNDEKGTIKNSYATGTVTGTGEYDAVGGLVGCNFGIIKNSYAIGDVLSSDATCSWIGGLVGSNLKYNTNPIITQGYWNTDAKQIIKGVERVDDKIGVQMNTGTALITAMSTEDMTKDTFLETLNNTRDFLTVPEGVALADWDRNDSENNGYPFLVGVGINHEVSTPVTEVILGEGSLGTAGNEKITGLTSGKRYKVTEGEEIKYVKANGTLSDNKEDLGELEGTEIIGLSNDITYKVEEYIPATATVLNITVEQGTKNGSTKATITDTATSKFVINITDSEVSVPNVEDEAPNSGDNLIADYTSGDDIATGVAVDKYLQVYDVNADNKVVKFYQKQLTAEDIKIDSRTLTDEDVEVSGGIITKYEGTKTDIIIPSVLDGQTVTGIGNTVFYNKNLTNVTIPDSVINIEAFAFNYNQLTNLTIPNSVSSVGNSAFAVNKLTIVTIKNKDTTIDKSVFLNQQLSDGKGSMWYENPDLSGDLFDFDAERTGEVTIYSYPQVVLAEGSLGTLDNNNIIGLESGKKYKVTVDGLTKYVKPDGTLSDNRGDVGVLVGTEINGLEVGKTYKVEEYVPATAATLNVTVEIGSEIGSTKATITDTAISKFIVNITDLEVKTPTIEDVAPTNGDNLIPNYTSGADITKGVIVNKYLQIYDVDADNKVVKFYQKHLTAEDIKVDQRALTDDEVVATAGVITSYSGTKKDIIIPNILDGQTITGIGNNAFDGKKLTSVEISDSVTNIGEGAFFNNQLTSITIPNSVKSIGECAFANNQLVSVIIPDSVTSIGEEAFVGNQLTNVIIPDSLTTIESSIFEENKLTSVIIPDGVTNIGGSAFEENELINVIIPDSVINIGDYAFYDNQLSSVTIKNKDTTISSDAFDNQKLPDGFVFNGWYENLDLSGDQFDFTAERTDDLTIYSYPQAIKYRVTFNSNGADSPSIEDKEVNSNSKVTEPITPIKSGYTFDGWYKDSGFITKWNFTSDVVTEDITLYAKWTKISSSDSSSSSHNSSSGNLDNDNTVKAETDNGDFNVGEKKVNYNSDGKKETIIEVNNKSIEDIVNKLESNNKISIDAGQDTDIVQAELNVQSVKDMQDKDLVLQVKTDKAIYDLATSKIDIDNISKAIGEEVNLKDIEFSVEISKTNSDMVKVVKDSIKESGLAVIVPPVDFKIKASHKDKTYKVDKFKGFVSRKIEIPEGVDASKITTAVVIEKDGSIRHIPTFVTKIDGKYYANINSITNSTYTLIYNKEVFIDVPASHWAKEHIEKMASRMVVEGKEDGIFAPDEAITRGELTKTIVRALGLKPEEVQKFVDVESGSHISGYIGTAYSYGIIKGISKNMFNPEGLVTRQDTMTMIYRANKIADFINKGDIKDMDCYVDYITVSDYAKEAVDWNVNNGIVIGKTDNTLAPFDSITRAELCTLINKFLITAGLIE